LDKELENLRELSLGEQSANLSSSSTSPGSIPLSRRKVVRGAEFPGALLRCGKGGQPGAEHPPLGGLDSSLQRLERELSYWFVRRGTMLLSRRTDKIVTMDLVLKSAYRCGLTQGHVAEVAAFALLEGVLGVREVSRFPLHMWQKWRPRRKECRSSATRTVMKRIYCVLCDDWPRSGRVGDAVRVAEVVRICISLVSAI